MIDYVLSSYNLHIVEERYGMREKQRVLLGAMQRLDNLVLEKLTASNGHTKTTTT